MPARPRLVPLVHTRTYRTLFATPSWSVRSLLEHGREGEGEDRDRDRDPPAVVSPAQLRHLLRLSALPPPPSPAAERAMLSVLRQQLRFVRAVAGAVEAAAGPGGLGAVEPLCAVRDETAAARAEATIGLDALRDVLDREVRVGHYARPRRRADPDAGAAGGSGEEREGAMDLSELRGKMAGRYFVVRTGRPQEAGAHGHGGDGA